MWNFMEDGTYDAVVTDAEVDEENHLRIELVITIGPHVGRVVALRSTDVDWRHGVTGGLGEDPYALLGLAGTLRVRNGIPSFRPETSA